MRGRSSNGRSGSGGCRRRAGRINGRRLRIGGGGSVGRWNANLLKGVHRRRIGRVGSAFAPNPAFYAAVAYVGIRRAVAGILPRAVYQLPVRPIGARTALALTKTGDAGKTASFAVQFADGCAHSLRFISHCQTGPFQYLKSGELVF